MADQKPTTNFYQNLGGVNQKASEYSVNTTQFLDIRNLDFDVPNALQKRPGSTQAVSVGTSGPIIGVYEFQKLDGASWVVAASNNALFYLASNAYTLLDADWTNGQPPDFVTFVNKLWIANGQLYKWWSGQSLFTAGLPKQGVQLTGRRGGSKTLGTFRVFGITMAAYSGPTVGQRAVLVGSYAYLRTDGFISPDDLVNNATPLSPFDFEKDGVLFASYLSWACSTFYTQNGDYGRSATMILEGFTAPAGIGISGYAVFLAMDVWTGITANLLKTYVKTDGTLNMLSAFEGLRDDANLSSFRYYTTVAAGTTLIGLFGETFTWSDLALQLPVYTPNSFDFFSTYTPKYLEQNQNIMFYAGFSSAPSVVYHSEVGDPEYIDAEYNFEVRTNDGDRVTGLRAFNNYVLIFKQESFHKVIGDNIDNFELVELSTEYGCLSQNTIIQYQEKLMWLDRKGILEFDGASWSVISDAVEDVFRRMNIEAALDKACAVHQKYRNQIWFGIPVDGSTQNNLTVVYDYLLKAWTFFDGFSPASFGFVKGSLTKETVWRGDYSGMVYYHGESFFGDNGQGITCSAFTRFEQFQGENSSSIWRRFFLDVAPAIGLTGVINGRVFSNYDRSTVQATFAMFQDSFQSRAEMGVVGKAVACQFTHFSASLPLLINGYSWTKRYLRNV